MTQVILRKHAKAKKELGIDLQYVDRMICDIRQHIDSFKYTALDWDFFNAIEEQFLRTRLITKEQFEALEKSYHYISQ